MATPRSKPTSSASKASLRTYRAKRDPAKTPEPMGDRPARRSKAKLKFVIQEHHARALHWDLRLEHDGVLASWALPKGIPEHPKVNHLAVHTEDHPIDYDTFEGEIPAGEYGGGTMRIWDRGTFEVEKWKPAEVIVVLHGTRVSGRYVLFATDGKNWMIHRMDPAPEGFELLPKSVKPMLATAGALPRDDSGWAYEIKWDGVRAITFVDGGRIRMQSRNDQELAPAFPEFREIGEVVGARPCVLDGEIIVMGEDGVPDFGRLAHRLHLTKAASIKTQAAQSPASYVIFDLLHLDGHSLVDRTYDERREQLEQLTLSGTSFTTAESFRGVKGADILEATKAAGLEGVIAKARRSTYQPGRRSDQWIKIKNVRTQEVVIGGWTPGAGNRAGSIGALLLGVPGDKGLRYVGKVGTGFSEADRAELLDLLERARTTQSPFVPPSDVEERAIHYFVRPQHVGEVRFTEWTSAGRLRHPTWRGLRVDKAPEEVTIES
ncbi:MAG TPA: non-homologous end-joining DNA ligase [Acidimicrobiales bacterium]